MFEFENLTYGRLRERRSGRIEKAVGRGNHGRGVDVLLTIAPDPHVTLSPSAYAEQFALARQIEATRAPVHAALDDAEAVLKKLADRTDAAAEATKTRARDISEFEPRPLPDSSPSTRLGMTTP